MHCFAPSRVKGIPPASFLLQGVVAKLLSKKVAWIGAGERDAGLSPEGPCPSMSTVESWGHSCDESLWAYFIIPGGKQCESSHPNAEVC